MKIQIILCVFFFIGNTYSQIANCKDYYTSSGCMICDANYYRYWEEEFSAICKSCPSGKYSEAGIYSNRNKDKCKVKAENCKDYYTGDIECMVCDDNYYKIKDNLCESCPSGKYSSAGLYQNYKIEQCKEKEKASSDSGSVSDSKQVANCKRYSVAVNNKCLVCEDNYYGGNFQTPVGGEYKECYSCPPGTFSKGSWGENFEVDDCKEKSNIRGGTSADDTSAPDNEVDDDEDDGEESEPNWIFSGTTSNIIWWCVNVVLFLSILAMCVSCAYNLWVMNCAE